tara:strand:- start:143 stop:328 length:186 start_codon:yes stop_codon:yes gene_type:complete
MRKENISEILLLNGFIPLSRVSESGWRKMGILEQKINGILGHGEKKGENFRFGTSAPCSFS